MPQSHKINQPPKRVFGCDLSNFTYSSLILYFIRATEAYFLYLIDTELSHLRKK